MKYLFRDTFDQRLKWKKKKNNFVNDSQSDSHRHRSRMHKCTRGCVVLFRRATGVGTHGLPTRSRVSDLTGRVIDAAISPAAPRRSLCRRCSISRPREARALLCVWWCYRHRIFIPRVPRIRGCPFGSGSPRKKNRWMRRKRERKTGRRISLTRWTPPVISRSVPVGQRHGQSVTSTSCAVATTRREVLLIRFWEKKIKKTDARCFLGKRARVWQLISFHKPRLRSVKYFSS